MKKYYSIYIKTDKSVANKFGWFQAIWGTDVWINGMPIMKLILIANIVTWTLMIWTK